MNQEERDRIWQIMMDDKIVDDVCMKIMQDYEYGVLSADDTIKSLAIIASSRLKQIQFIGDQCFNYIEDEIPPFLQVYREG